MLGCGSLLLASCSVEAPLDKDTNGGAEVVSMERAALGATPTYAASQAVFAQELCAAADRLDGEVPFFDFSDIVPDWENGWEEDRVAVGGTVREWVYAIWTEERYVLELDDFPLDDGLGAHVRLPLARPRLHVTAGGDGGGVLPACYVSLGCHMFSTQEIKLNLTLDGRVALATVADTLGERRLAAACNSASSLVDALAYYLQHVYETTRMTFLKYRPTIATRSIYDDGNYNSDDDSYGLGDIDPAVCDGDRPSPPDPAPGDPDWGNDTRYSDDSSPVGGGGGGGNSSGGNSNNSGSSGNSNSKPSSGKKSIAFQFDPNDEQQDELKRKLVKIFKDCLGGRMLGAMAGKTISISTVEEHPYYGSYNRKNGDITIRTDAVWFDGVLLEELFHAYQHSRGSNMSQADTEFEAKCFIAKAIEESRKKNGLGYSYPDIPDPDTWDSFKNYVNNPTEENFREAAGDLSRIFDYDGASRNAGGKLESLKKLTATPCP